MVDALKPTTEEVKEWLLSTLRHCCQVEFYLHRLNLGNDDPQRPHDIIGPGNKYLWPVLKGFAVQYRSDDPEFFHQYVLPVIEIHRQSQYHHQKWNWPNPNANDDDMKVGAIDSLCSLLDDRRYQGGSHSFEDMIRVIKGNEPHQVKWFWMVYSQMKRTASPAFETILSLDDIPNTGLPDEMYCHIVSRTRETVEMLREDHGYIDL